jgi:hypothetical protein
MTSTIISIPVDAATALAYSQASLEEQKKNTASLALADP